MPWRILVLSAVGIAVLAALFGASFMLSLPPPPSGVTPPPIPPAEVEATLAALKPPKRQRPLIAILAINDAPRPPTI